MVIDPGLADIVILTGVTKTYEPRPEGGSRLVPRKPPAPGQKKQPAILRSKAVQGFILDIYLG